MVRHKNRYLLLQVQYRTPFIEFADNDDGGGSIISFIHNNDGGGDGGMEEPEGKRMKGSLKRYPESSRVMYDAIIDAIEKEYGIFGRGTVKRSLAIKYWSNKTGSCIVRCARAWHEMVIAAINTITTFTFVNEERQFGTCDASLRILHVSGTINLCTRAAINLGKAYIASVDTPKDKKDKEDDVVEEDDDEDDDSEDDDDEDDDADGEYY